MRPITISVVNTEHTPPSITLSITGDVHTSHGQVIVFVKADSASTGADCPVPSNPADFSQATALGCTAVSNTGFAPALPLNNYVIDDTPRPNNAQRNEGSRTPLTGGLQTNTNYCIWVRSNAGASGSNRIINSATTVTITPPPSQPAPVTFTSVTANSVVINWTAPAENGAAITSYTLTRTPAFTSAVTVTGLTYTDTGLEPDTEYTYQVAATNSAGTSTPSVAAMTTTAAPTSDAQVDATVLPEVLRGTTRGINNSIYQRIQQRQREDGRWK